MKMLKSKLIEIKEREHLDRIEDIKGEQMQIAWGIADPLLCVHALYPCKGPPHRL